MSLMSTSHPALHNFTTDTSEWDATPGLIVAVLVAVVAIAVSFAAAAAATAAGPIAIVAVPVL